MPLTSIQTGGNAEVFYKVLTFYVPPPAKILDVTCGYKRFWEKFALGVQGSYDVVFSDIRTLGDVRADYHNLPFREGLFDCIVFDPPFESSWGYHPERFKQHKRYKSGVYIPAEDGRDAYGLGKEGFHTEEYDAVGLQFFNALRSHGTLIHKIQDLRREGWTHMEAERRLRKYFQLDDLIIYDTGSKSHMLLQFNRVGISGDWRKWHAVKTHAYFMVFKRRY